MESNDLEGMPPEPPRTGKHAYRVWPRRLLWAAISFFVLMAVGLITLRFMLPGLIQRGAAQASLQHLGLATQIGSVDLRLLSGEILCEGITIARPPSPAAKAGAPAPPGEAAPSLLTIQRLALRWSWSDLWKKQLTVTSLAIDGPALSLARETDGSIDPLRHAVPSTPPAAGSPAPSNTRSWPVQVRSFVLRTPKVLIADAASKNKLLEFSLESLDLDEVSVTDGNIGLGSLAVRGPQLWVQRDLVQRESSSARPPAKDAPAAGNAAPGLHIRALDVQRAKFTWEGKEGPLDVLLTLKVKGVTAEAKKQFPLDLTLQIGDGGLKLTGDAGIFPPYFRGKVAWHDLACPPLLLATRPELVDWLQSANSTGNIDLVFDSAGLMGLPVIHVSGRTKLENLAAAAPGNNRVTLGCDRLELVINKLVYPLALEGAPPRPIIADFESITAETPWLVYAHPASFWGLMSDGSEPFLAEASIGRLRLNGGDIKLHDTTVATTSRISNFTVAMDNVRYPQLACDLLSLQATLPAAALFSLEGHVRPGWEGDFQIALQDLDLPPWNPYAAAFGVSLDAGTVSLQTKLAFAGTTLTADNEVTLRHMQLSIPKAPSSACGMGIPLNLALALLRDPAGNIKLTVPVRIDESGATVSKNEVIGSAVQAAFLGALSSPLKLLGIGAKGSPPAAGKATPLSIPPFTCAPGSSDPLPEAAARTQKIVKLLTERPELAFTITGHTGPEDRPILAERILLEQAKAGEKLPKMKDAGFLALRRIGIHLEKRAKGEPIELAAEDRPLYDRFVAAVDVPQTRLDTLATERAEKLRKLLLKKGVAPTQLKIEKTGLNPVSGSTIAFQLSQTEEPAAKRRPKARTGN